MRPSRRHVVFFGSIRTDSSARRTSHSASSLLAFARGFMPALLVAAAAFGAVIPGSDGETGPNSDPNYLALRNITLGSEAVSVTNFDLKRDAGTFHLHSGTVCFVPPVNGRVTGAVFAGDGSFVLNPPTEAERKSLNYLTKETQFDETLERLRASFTDCTYRPPPGGLRGPDDPHRAPPARHNARKERRSLRQSDHYVCLRAKRVTGRPVLPLPHPSRPVRYR